MLSIFRDNLIVTTQTLNLALVENKEGEYFYKARDLRWAPEVDGEILINDSELTTPLKPGHYTIVPSAFKDNILLAKVLSPF
ncbi:hypothetical protein E5P75_05035 [Helicobacter pylori]|nr:ribosomal S12 methylthiotransferase RimO domain protein [Helicobacter pylori Hp H-28]WQX07497.1 hypothetical protein E5P75_05035 [Helicobacter pylori]